ncbi:hypothetical protein MSAN_02222600 [Mycena sanguinolenta]|uniref:Uncharacterized protein n=1 Tax=Mycena sanguinolenta TaxID=230812 RepID=A0A8H7CIF9_9AGAR|nr:hypothetical protein MSAN_02222600 [Mycena sanguinolenta]
MSSTSTAPTAPSPDKCVYDVAWIDRTFHRRKTAESLLGPELENGNLTQKDYDRLVAFVPGGELKSNIMGLSLSAVITTGVWALSKKRPNTILLTAGGWVFGETLGKGFRVNAHLKYLRSLEDVNGFSRAMENIKRKVGYTPGLIQLVKPLSSLDGELAPFQKEIDTSYYEEKLPESTTTPSPTPTSRPQPPAASPAPAKSRWDEIRATRHVDGPSKAWENIRQGRRPDGTSLPTKSEFESRSEPSEASPYRDIDRAAAQASFDALLERERRMSSSQ